MNVHIVYVILIFDLRNLGNESVTTNYMALKLLRVKGDYVSIKGTEIVFKTDKIVNVNIRSAWFYWTNPYIMTVKYGKHWEKTEMVMSGRVPVPYTTYQTSQDIEFRVKDESDVHEYVREWNVLGVDVTNTSNTTTKTTTTKTKH